MGYYLYCWRDIVIYVATRNGKACAIQAEVSYEQHVIRKFIQLDMQMGLHDAMVNSVPPSIYRLRGLQRCHRQHDDWI